MNSKTLFDILPDFLNAEMHGSTEVKVAELSLDSREVATQYMFAAIPGTSHNGHDFIQKAIANGASCILLEKLPESLEADVSYIQVNDSREALALIACEFYGNPSKDLTLIGITGTNGKSTCATLLYELFRKIDVKVGLLSTIKYAFDSHEESATHTTPDAITINRLLRRMVDASCTHAVMEVSSHALDQRRTAGLDYDVALFTNLTHDHIGYHGTFKNYMYAKKRLFDLLRDDAFAIVNEDDPKHSIMLEHCKAKVFNFGLQSMSDYRAKLLSNSMTGLQLRINGYELHSALVGEYNAQNLLAVYSILDVLGYDPKEFTTAISTLKGVPGRFEVIARMSTSTFGIVDYAHTPDALLKVLQNINSLKEKNQKVITVVGCGGDRDTAKRPVMARIAAEKSDYVILTSDNPRSENPQSILDEMELGISEDHHSKTERIENRKEAIQYAVMLAESNAIILVAGKGHEKYQEIKGKKLPFDDLKILTTTLFNDIKE